MHQEGLRLFGYVCQKNTVDVCAVICLHSMQFSRQLWNDHRTTDSVAQKRDPFWRSGPGQRILVDSKQRTSHALLEAVVSLGSTGSRQSKTLRVHALANLPHVSATTSFDWMDWHDPCQSVLRSNMKQLVDSTNNYFYESYRAEQYYKSNKWSLLHLITWSVRCLRQIHTHDYQIFRTYFFQFNFAELQYKKTAEVTSAEPHLCSAVAHENADGLSGENLKMMKQVKCECRTQKNAQRKDRLYLPKFLLQKLLLIIIQPKAC